MSDGATKDALLGGRVVFYQPRRGEGYRTSADAVLLARFAGARAASARTLAYDLGAGTGAVGIVLAATGGASELCLVDKDRDALALAEQNLAANGLQGQIVCSDVATLGHEHDGRAAIVVCNPPYFIPGRGRPALASRRDARSGEVRAFLTCTARILGRRGRACFVYPAPDLARLLDDLQQVGLVGKRAVFVHSSTDRPARVVLLEAQRAKPGGLVVEPPWFEDSEAIRGFLRGVF